MTVEELIAEELAKYQNDEIGRDPLGELLFVEEHAAVAMERESD